MRSVERFAVAIVAGVTALAAAQVWADPPAHPPRPHAEVAHARAEPPHAHAEPARAHPAPVRACLSQKERRAEAGKIIRLAAAMRVAKKRMPGTVVRALLCRGHNGLVYVLTVLAHDGKVARLTVDAVKGTLLGG